VQTRVNGVIEQLYVRALYDPVARDAPLAAIYSPDWLSAQEEYLALLRNPSKIDAILVSAARQRLALQGVPEAQIRRIEEEGKPNPRVTLMAPASGVVWEIGAREGAAVGPGMTIFRIASLGTVWINAEIPEAQAGLVSIGAPVEARASAFPDRVLKGTVAAILPDVNTQTRTLKARVVVANPGGLLRPGMFANLTFHAGAGKARDVLLVPTEAVIRTGTRSVVIVTTADGGLRPIEVEVGRESGERTEIRKGLSAGQKVVVSGQFLIDSEASLKSTLKRMDAGDGQPAPAAAAAPMEKALGPRMEGKP
jgi:Cu(I)/Ag(I) efflux system membrane fusion protein